MPLPTKDRWHLIRVQQKGGLKAKDHTIAHTSQRPTGRTNSLKEKRIFFLSMILAIELSSIEARDQNSKSHKCKPEANLWKEK
jgi:hypothetical protein